MKVLNNSIKDDADALLVKLAKILNDRNPIINRIMEDESVDGVIMTNRDGIPLITSINSITAAHYSSKLQRLGVHANYSIRELNPFDEVLVLRIQTKKNEILLAPHAEFNIAIIQRARQKTLKDKTEKKK